MNWMEPNPMNEAGNFGLVHPICHMACLHLVALVRSSSRELLALQESGPMI